MVIMVSKASQPQKDKYYMIPTSMKYLRVKLVEAENTIGVARYGEGEREIGVVIQWV